MIRSGMSVRETADGRQVASVFLDKICGDGAVRTFTLTPEIGETPEEALDRLRARHLTLHRFRRWLHARIPDTPGRFVVWYATYLALITGTYAVAFEFLAGLIFGAAP